MLEVNLFPEMETDQAGILDLVPVSRVVHQIDARLSLRFRQRAGIGLEQRQDFLFQLRRVDARVQIRLVRRVELFEIGRETDLIRLGALLHRRRTPDQPGLAVLTGGELGQLSRPLVVVGSEKKHRDGGLTQLVLEIQRPIRQQAVALGRELRGERRASPLKVATRLRRVEKYRRAVVPHALEQIHKLADKTTKARFERRAAGRERVRLVAERNVGEARKQCPMLVAVDGKNRAAEGEELVRELLARKPGAPGRIGLREDLAFDSRRSTASARTSGMEATGTRRTI